MKVVKMLWIVALFTVTLLELVMLAIAVLLFWPPNSVMFWFFAVAPAGLGAAVAYGFLRQVGALGQAPSGLWGQTRSGSGDAPGGNE